MTPTRIALVGVGRMGLRHAEALAALQRAGRPLQLAGLVDVDRARLSQLEGRLALLRTEVGDAPAQPPKPATRCR